MKISTELIYEEFIDKKFKASVLIIFFVIAYFTYCLLSVKGGNIYLDIISYVGLIVLFINKIRNYKYKGGIEKINLIASSFTIFPFFLLTSENLHDFIMLIILAIMLFLYFLKFLNTALFEEPFLFIIILSLNILFIGTLGIYNFEDITFAQSFWLTIVSATTVGYGDYVATTFYGQLVSVFIILSGTIVLGAMLTTIIIHNVQKNRLKVIISHFNREEKKSNIKEKKIVMLFKEFKKGGVNINELENSVLEIVKEKDDRSK